MTQPRPELIAAADPEARSLARGLIGANHAALAYLDPATQTPGISRIALGLCPEGWPLTLISELAPHTAALRANPAAAVMVGDVGDKGDPLTHPRLMIRVKAAFLPKDDLRDHWLAHHPKAKLYVDFTDFSFVRMQPISALLNAGFARAFRLTPEELRQGAV